MNITERKSFTGKEIDFPTRVINSPYYPNGIPTYLNGAIGINICSAKKRAQSVGSVFKHVSDSALYPCGGDECHHCGRADRPIYDYTGQIVEPSLAANPKLAAEEPHVYEVCADCIREGNLRKAKISVDEIMP